MLKKRIKEMAENFFGITDTGKLRDNNEDTFIANTIFNNRFIVASVIDGVGGYEGGEVAAKLAKETILDRLKKPAADIIKLLKDAVTAANNKIHQEKQSGKGNNEMACVLTLALVNTSENKFYYAHVGDTRLYLFRDHSLVKITHDHSFVGFLEESGRLSEEAAMNHPKRNEINKALGFNEQQFLEPDYIETGESPFLPGDILLLCSDGLSDMISNNTITSLLSSNKNLKEKGRALIKAANEAGGKDNITVALVKNDRSPLLHEATKPVITKKKENNEQGIIASEELKSNLNIVTTPAKRNNTVLFLSIFLLILLAALSWFIYDDFFKKENTKVALINNEVQRPRNADEQRLSDSINNTNNQELFLNRISANKSIQVSDSLIITKDSLHIIGNGYHFICDSAYKGAAFIITSNCKYILLDSVTFENFNTGIFAKNKALHLKGIQFKNCKAPIRFEPVLPDTAFINGKFVDSLFFNSDSIKKNHL